MALNEACQLWIEQEIETGLEDGKTPYAIGKEIAKDVSVVFEVRISPDTIRKRAERQQGDYGQMSINNSQPPENIRNRHPQGGGKREGAGRPPKIVAIDSKSQFRTSFSGENEWYTPLVYIEAAREVMDEIDLDPATSEYGQSRIKATAYYTTENDGLKQPWSGRLWLNPPYSNPLLSNFIDKFVKEYQSGNITEAIILTHNYTDTKWFHKAEIQCSLICFTLGRIKFEDKDGNVASPTQGSAFFYFGSNPDGFEKVFGRYGFIR